METPELPESCLRGDHDYDQTGRCMDCLEYRTEVHDSWENRRSGGAGSLSHPLTNGEYEQEMQKLAR